MPVMGLPVGTDNPLAKQKRFIHYWKARKLSIRVTEAGLGIHRILSEDFTVEPEMLDAGDKLLLCPLALTELLLELVGVVSIENGFHELLTGA
nr:hypothetical protein Iba_chr12aCG19120 [Ipomoea batatas]